MNKRDELQEKALAAACQYKRSGLNLSVGFGKTKVGLMYLKKAGGNTLVVVPKLDIIKSWQDDAEKFGYQDVMERCSFTTYLSLNKNNPNNYQNLVMDEAHNAKSSHLPFLSNFKGNVLGLTGTPPKWKNSEKGQIMSNYYPIRYSYTTDEAVDDEILNDYNIIVHYLTLNERKDSHYVIRKFGKNYHTSEKKAYLDANRAIDKATTEKSRMFAQIMRIHALKTFKTKEHYTKKLIESIPEDEKLLIFANTIDQAERLYPATHNSKNKNSSLELFKRGAVTRLSCVEQLSEGINIPNLKHAIVLHSYSGSSPKQAQKFGRLMRLPTTEVATIHILCYKGTIDEKWVNSNLEKYNQDKIKHLIVN
jgi:superfamily II DNA or RNA helicase